jgi:hypothetical protein
MEPIKTLPPSALLIGVLSVQGAPAQEGAARADATCATAGGVDGVHRLLLHTIQLEPRHEVHFFKFREGLAGIAGAGPLGRTFRRLQRGEPIPPGGHMHVVYNYK